MGLAHAQVRFQRTTGLPEDVVVNSFWFGTPTLGDVTVAEATAISARLQGFYNTVHAPSTVTLRSLMADTLATNHEIRVYDMEEPMPRTPVLIDPFPSAPTSTVALPGELALCLSFAAAAASGSPPARRRGRVYCGPFNQGAGVFDLGTEVAGDVRPHATLMNVLLNGGLKLITENATAGASTWGVWSEVDLTFRPAVRCWVDNAWDIQRRRGAAPTARVQGP